MSTLTPSDAQQKANVSTDEVAQQFLTKASNYFRSEIRCMLISLS